MSDKELIEFTENMASININLTKEELADFKREWEKVKGIQPPLIETHRNGLSIFLPWIQEES